MRRKSNEIGLSLKPKQYLGFSTDELHKLHKLCAYSYPTNFEIVH